MKNTTRTKRTIWAIIVFIVAAFAIFFFFLPGEDETETEPEDEKTQSPIEAQKPLRIYSFNIQIFGAAKMAKQEVVDLLLQIVSGADIVAIQEVRSLTPDPVEQFMALLPPQYNYVLGPREGRTSSKEQYWIIYDSTAVTVIGEDTYPDPQDLFQRNPLAVYCKSAGNFDFIIIDNHVQPSDAAQEIGALVDVIEYYQDLWHDTDILVLGDFNADGAYYDENLLAQVFPADRYYSLISNDYDTTVASGDNTYDRFIITKSAGNYYTGNSGVIRFDEVYDFSLYSIEPKDVSDHYPIWAEFSITANPAP
ncbi:MAG: endonuclease [Spirochaetaceae bacterium]|jgi:endonuclease/exonuclease/phosphatase family metal-dependent hydrolase|nr:endonuclease [Spirochaetaceae bacterium]